MRALRDLGDGLTMRQARPEDAGRPGLEGAWARELLTGTHPGALSGRGFVVEDTRTGTIASAILCLSHTWSYGGVRFPVCQAAIVGTEPQYRRRGLVRAQFEAVHAWSARRGHLVQVISGIPYFYRQFGYELAIEAEAGRGGPASLVPQLPEAESERYVIRRATEADLPFIARVYRHGMQRYTLTWARDLAVWRYELGGKSSKSSAEIELQVIESRAGRRVGFLTQDAGLWNESFGLLHYELVPGLSWLEVTPAVLRHLCRAGAEHGAKTGKECRAINLWLGTDHPAYRVAGEQLPLVHPPYASYVRVPDVGAFLRRISPVLERRLAESVLVGHTGELCLSFFRSGLRLVIEKGKVAAADSLGDLGRASAHFPDLVFAKLLFGHRSMEELRHAYPDCRPLTAEAALLLGILFPKEQTGIWHVT